MDPRRTVEPVDAWEGISMALAGVEETARARAGRGAGGGGRGERVRRGGRWRRRIGGEGRGGPRRLVLLFSHAPCPGREGTDQTGAAPPESGRALGVGRGEQRRPRPPQPRRSLSFRPSRPADCSFFFFGLSFSLYLELTAGQGGQGRPAGGRLVGGRGRAGDDGAAAGDGGGHRPGREGQLHGGRGGGRERGGGGEKREGREREWRNEAKRPPTPPLFFFSFSGARAM